MKKLNYKEKKAVRDRFMDGDKRVAVNCKTKSEALMFLDYLTSIGLTWNGEESYNSRSKWNVKKENTVYYPSSGTYGSVKGTDSNTTILINYDEFMNTFNSFIKF